MTAPFCFILSYQRPLYLWATLNSLWQNTRRDVNFVITDNASEDPLVAQVIRSFDRRGMFHTVYMREENKRGRTMQALAAHRAELGDFFYFCENDVLTPSHLCWASDYETLYRSQPRLGMIGSMCEPADFPEAAQIERLFPGIGGEQLDFYVKARSPERVARLDASKPCDKAGMTNPPGRLMLLDTAAVAEVGFQPDHKLARALEAAGWDWTITTAFRHRHLSLANVFDYPPDEAEGASYDRRRAQFYRRTLRQRVSDRLRRLARPLTG